jgi:hypothetical protein
MMGRSDNRITLLNREFDFPRDGFCNFSQLPSDAPSHLHSIFVLSHIRIGSLSEFVRITSTSGRDRYVAPHP